MKKVEFTDLDIWKEARKYRNRLSKVVDDFPKRDKDRLGYDIIDSSRAIGIMIAKGNAGSISENIYSCETAISFAAETMDMLIIAHDEGYIKKAHLNKYKRWYKRLVEGIAKHLVFLRKQGSKQ